MIYETPEKDIPLSQGDILDDCPLLFWSVPSKVAENEPESETGLVRAVVLTQACDLAQAKATRVLIAVVHNADYLVTRGILKGPLIRDQIRNHRVYGWYFLPSSLEMNESLIDLRDLHTIPRSLLENLIQQEKRVCRIRTPYREHLAQHFANTYSRIGLPDPYQTKEE